MNKNVAAKIPRKRHWNVPDKSVWGRIVGNVAREIILTQRLPTNHAIMQCYNTMRMSKSNRTTVNEFALKPYEEILPIWQKANNPTMNKNNCVKRLTTLLSFWSKQDCC